MSDRIKEEKSTRKFQHVYYEIYIEDIYILNPRLVHSRLSDISPYGIISNNGKRIYFK